MVISDAHKGIQKAVESSFLGASWQYCQVHFSKAVLESIPKRTKQRLPRKLKEALDEESKMQDLEMELGADSGGKINTSYIERLNLTIRNSLARLVRKSMNCSKISVRHTHARDFFQAWYNFVKPHKSLRLRIDQGRKKWIQPNLPKSSGAQV